MVRKISIFVCLLMCFQFLVAQEREYIQIRKYHFDNEQQLELSERFFESTLIPTLKEEGFDRIGVFKNHREKADTILNVYLILPVSALGSLYDVEAELMDEFPKVQHFSRVENIFLRSFVDMPGLIPSQLVGPRKDRIYELRSYESATDVKFKNKVDMFNAGGEVQLFDDLGFNAVFYGEVIAGSSMPNLMYMTTHENAEARTKNWKAFSESPVWTELKNLPKYQDNVSHIDIIFLYPTAYSDY